jgi:hypothetical protein
MSFTRFIFWCAIVGGWAAFVGWFFGAVLTSREHALAGAGLKGMFLGLAVALGLGLLDSMWNLSIGKMLQIVVRVGVGVLVGCVGGLLGGVIGQGLINLLDPGAEKPIIFGICFIFGWTLTGLLIGASIGVFEMLLSVIKQQDVSGAVKKLIKGLVGGTAGGLLGGILAVLFRVGGAVVFRGKDPDDLSSPTAWGFVALGMCIGLLIGLAQVILKEAWVRIEVGRKAGKEMFITKEKTSIGRAEACDIGLFGDNQIEKFHAHIVQSGNRYFLEDLQTPGGTYVNDNPVQGRTPLQSGDLIRVGNSVLCFRERQKRN